jgi:quercetin dioxygenase-like cupin family protein
MVATKHTYLRTHTITGKALQFALKTDSSDLIERARASKAGRTATTLVKDGPLRITLVALRKGVTLQEHQVSGAASIQTLRGRLALNVEGSELDLRPGQLAALGAGVRHVATALTDCAILITMSID